MTMPTLKEMRDAKVAKINAKQAEDTVRADVRMLLDSARASLRQPGWQAALREHCKKLLEQAAKIPEAPAPAPTNGQAEQDTPPHA
jgi:hypothetical protein